MKTLSGHNKIHDNEFLDKTVRCPIALDVAYHATVNCKLRSDNRTKKMEEGSLLQQALQKESEDQAAFGEKNAILLDVHLLKGECVGHTSHLLQLAALSGKCNRFLQSQDYLWHYGCDGPVFGVHVDNVGGGGGIPHLRAYCRYGPSVLDEWVAIDFMMEMSKVLEEEIAISCWDVDDGQVIMIQSSDALPEWADEDPTDNHRYACWICHGQIQLIRKSHITLQDALKELRKHRDENSSHVTSHPKIQKSLNQWLVANRQHAAVALQRTPFVVPRKIATILRTRPDLAHTAIQAFCDNLDSSPPDLTKYEDWVWTTHTLSRTNYAMARTMVSAEWKLPEWLPPVGVEVKRYKRKCAMESTPHLQYAVQLGVRLVGGFEFLSKQTKKSNISPPPPSPPSLVEQRIAHWSRIDQDCEGADFQHSWILDSFQQGPNRSDYNLEHLLKCPVFPEENRKPTLYSYPEMSIRQQLVEAQKSMDLDEDLPMPLSDQVDGESWLVLEGGDTPGSNNDLDGMLSRFQNFMMQPSDAEGVTSSQPSDATSKEIRPRVFLNILHAVLKGEEISFPITDPFFYDEDYGLMDINDDDAESENVQAMKGLMVSAV